MRHLPYGRTDKAQKRQSLARAVIEALDARQLMCAMPATPQTLGAATPWLSAPVTVGDTTPYHTDADATPRATAAPAPIRINAGGGNYTDTTGVTFASDRYFSGGSADAAWVFPVANTTSDPLYYVRRWGAFSYNIPIAAAGTYNVKLHFADPKYTTGGNRTFDVRAEGVTKLNDFDVAANGGGRAAIVRSFDVSVSDGTLNLNFVKQLENPIVSAIEVIAKDVTPTPPPPTTGIDTFTNISYATKAANPIHRSEALKATWNGRLYTFGGFNLANGPVLRSDYYNPATNTWTRIADLPQHLTHVGMAQDASNAYLVGGYVGNGKGYGQVFGSNKVWKYNFASNSYSALPNLPQSLAGGGAAIVGRNLHYFSGQNASRGDIKIHLVLNLDNLSGGWKNAAPIPHVRSHMGSVVLGGKIYAVGGQIGNDSGLTTLKWVDVYDPATNSWSTRASLPRSISHISSSTFVMGGRILVMGGESAHNAQLRDVFAYNPSTNRWSSLTPLPAARFSGVADDINGKIYFTTGGNATTTWAGTPV